MITEELKRKAEAEEEKIRQFNSVLNGLEKIDITLRSEKNIRKDAALSPFIKTAPICEVKNFVVLDTETTGLDPACNDIVEISAIRFENFKPVSLFTTLLKPNIPISERASEISGITNEMVENSPSFSEIKSSLKDFIGNLPIVAHNASFDIKFLYASGFDFDKNTVFYDTLALSREHITYCEKTKCKPKSYRLGNICSTCDIYFDGAHRASADALATGLLFTYIVNHTICGTGREK